MFSPAVHEGGPAMATRSRRRQRPASSDNSIQQPKAKRQRLPLTEATFVNPDAGPEMFEIRPDKVAALGPRRPGLENASAPAPNKELSVRSKKPKPGERISKGDGSVVLTSNNAYTVSKLPALPDRIRADWSSKIHGTVYASSGYGICLTHTHALVWPYAVNSGSPETFTFALPYPSRHVNDPLPLGALVAPSASSDDPGLVVVMPVTGKITYWESISSAATLDFLRQQRNGVEDSVPGMFSGEVVSQIVNAETAGYVLVLDSGRLAYLNVRDSHGRPAISVQFLRSGLGVASGGFFGSIRHALKQSTIRGNVTSVKAAPTNKVGERVVAAATSKGRIQVWRVQRGGNHDVLAETDARDDIVNAIRSRDPTIDGAFAETFEVLDLAFVPRGLEQKHKDMTGLTQAVDDDDESTQHLLLLVAFRGKEQAPYSLVEVAVSQGTARVGMVRTLSSYSNPINRNATDRPRLYLPKPAIVAYVVFDRAVVIASIAQPPDTPDSQLRDDSNALPPTFEDVVDLSDREGLEVVGSGAEEPAGPLQEAESARSYRHKTKNPATVLIVRGVGLIRVGATDVDRFGSERPPRVTAKSKLEQAVFFGSKDDNPLVFEGRRSPQFSSKEIGDAALQLSHDILSSCTPYIASLPASIADNLTSRSNYLHKLMVHLNALKVPLDRQTRWALLWNAEKMATAKEIWLQHQQFLSDRADTKGAAKKSLVSEIVEYIHEDEKKNPDRSVGEVDAVRHFFLNDVWRLEIFIAWAYEVIKYVYKEHLLDDKGITRLVYEAVEINSLSLQKAWEYRVTNAPFYGLDRKELDRGILLDGYEGLPEPWTSTFFIINNAKRLVELCYQWLDQYYPPQVDTPGAPDPGLIESIREKLPELTGLYLDGLQEHARWAKTRSDVQEQQYGDRCAKTYAEDRYSKILRLKDFKLWEEAVRVAERHYSLRAMAEVMVEEVRTLRLDAMSRDIPPSRATELRNRAALREEQISDYFKSFSDKFAFCVYDILLRDEGIKAVLDFPRDDGGYVTRFLRSKPELARISWIHDVEGEKSPRGAADTLLDLGLNQEQQMWNKKIELSLAKLALMAAGARASSARRHSSLVPRGQDDTGKLVANVDRNLRLIKIQDKLYNWVVPTITTAVDEAAELVLAMEGHSSRIPKKHKALVQLFKDSMSRLLKHEALDAPTLIDLLTLGTYDNDDSAYSEDLFYLALVATEQGMAGDEQQEARRLIWRRCLIRDDWSKINNTHLQDDEATKLAVDGTALWGALSALSCLRPEPQAPSAKQPPKADFYPIVKPSEALGVYTEQLDSRFGDRDDGFREKLLEAMRWEDSVLRKYVEKSQLDKWFRTVADGAEQLRRPSPARDSPGFAQADGVNGAAVANGNIGNGHAALEFEEADDT